MNVLQLGVGEIDHRFSAAILDLLVQVHGVGCDVARPVEPGRVHDVHLGGGDGRGVAIGADVGAAVLQENPDFLAAIHNLVALDHVEFHLPIAHETIEQDVFGEIDVGGLLLEVVKRDRVELGQIECHDSIL